MHYIVGEKCHTLEHTTSDEIMYVKLFNDVLFTATKFELCTWNAKVSRKDKQNSYIISNNITATATATVIINNNDNVAVQS